MILCSLSHSTSSRNQLWAYVLQLFTFYIVTCLTVLFFKFGTTLSFRFQNMFNLSNTKHGTRFWFLPFLSFAPVATFQFLFYKYRPAPFWQEKKKKIQQCLSVPVYGVLGCKHSVSEGVLQKADHQSGLDVCCCVPEYARKFHFFLLHEGPPEKIF